MLTHAYHRRDRESNPELTADSIGRKYDVFGTLYEILSKINVK